MRPLSGILCVLGLLSCLLTPQRPHASPHVQFDPPSIVSSVEAAYPLHSIASGTVVFELALDESGAITSVRVIHGIASLTEPAERSVQRWKFQPAHFEGKTVASKIAVAFTFVPPNLGPQR